MNSSFKNRTVFQNTPLSISVYSVKDKPLHMHPAGTLEIIFCLAGTVTFAYAYEEITLNAGEYISVDRDAYYLHSDRYNMCVSFYVDLMWFEKKYPNIKHIMFVCEGCAQTSMPYPTVYHDRLRGTLTALLKFILDGSIAPDPAKITRITSSIIDLFVHHFDISFFHCKSSNISSEVLQRNQDICAYFDLHFREKITLDDLAAHLGLSVSYLSEFMRKVSLGFRRMIAYIRANKSEWYLINTDLTIVEISEECGFSDPQYYYKSFKEWYKCTPKQFREKYIKQSRDNMVYYEPQVIRPIVDDLMVCHYMNLFLE